MPEGSDPGQEQDEWATFTVLAPPDWVDPTLGCQVGFGGNVDYAPGATGVDDPLTDAQQHASKDSTVRQAGYITKGELHFIGVTDGVVTASYVYRSDGHGGWLLSETGGCN